MDKKELRVMLIEDDRISTDEAFTKGLVLEIQRVYAENKALRTQLAQQAEMVEKCMVAMNANADEVDRLKGRLAALAEPSEAVAWRHKVLGRIETAEAFAKPYNWGDRSEWEPLFTHPASNHLDEIAKVLHYPDCWDVMAYPTLEDAIIEAKSWAHCTNEDCQCPTKEA